MALITTHNNKDLAKVRVLGLPWEFGLEVLGHRVTLHTSTGLYRRKLRPRQERECLPGLPPGKRLANTEHIVPAGDKNRYPPPPMPKHPVCVKCDSSKDPSALGGTTIPNQFLKSTISGERKYSRLTSNLPNSGTWGGTFSAWAGA